MQDKNFLGAIVGKILENIDEISNDWSHNRSFRSTFGKLNRQEVSAVVTEAVYKTYQAEMKELGDLQEQKRRLDTENAVAKAELARDRKLMELDLATKRDLLEQAIKTETDEEKRALMQTAVENIALKEKLDYLQGELSFYRGMAKDSNAAVNDTLRTAFTHQAPAAASNAT